MTPAASINAVRDLSAARFAEATGFTAVDIGARGGVDAAMLPLAWATEMIGFEPEPAEAAALQNAPATPWKSRRIIPAAVGGIDGPATLFIPPSPESASLLRHNSEMITWFGVESQHGVDREVTVETRTLDALAAEALLPPADYVKIDVEGAEGAILDGGKSFLRDTLAMRIEVAFLEQRLGQLLAWEIGASLHARGFLVIDMIALQHWRHGYAAAHPYRDRSAHPWSQGVLAQGDLICVRDFRRIDDPVTAAKLVLITAGLGYVDFAATILRHHQALLAPLEAAHGMSLKRDLEALARIGGKAAPAAAIRRSLRDLIPLGRSLFGGLPARS
jgi:FkbM family methyltransferase